MRVRSSGVQGCPGRRADECCTPVRRAVRTPGPGGWVHAQDSSGPFGLLRRGGEDDLHRLLRPVPHREVPAAVEPAERGLGDVAQARAAWRGRVTRSRRPQPSSTRPGVGPPGCRPLSTSACSVSNSAGVSAMLRRSARATCVGTAQGRGVNCGSSAVRPTALPASTGSTGRSARTSAKDAFTEVANTCFSAAFQKPPGSSATTCRPTPCRASSRTIRAPIELPTRSA